MTVQEIRAKGLVQEAGGGASAGELLLRVSGIYTALCCSPLVVGGENPDSLEEQEHLQCALFPNVSTRTLSRVFTREKLRRMSGASESDALTYIPS